MTPRPVALHRHDADIDPTGTLERAPQDVACINVGDKVLDVVECVAKGRAKPLVTEGGVLAIIAAADSVQADVHHFLEDVAGVRVCADDPHLILNDFSPVLQDFRFGQHQELLNHFGDDLIAHEVHFLVLGLLENICDKHLCKFMNNMAIVSEW